MLIQPALRDFGQIHGRVVGDGPAQDLEGPSSFLAAGVKDHSIDEFREVRVIGRAHVLRGEPEDHLMVCSVPLFPLLRELLFQLLAGAQADEFYRDVRRAHYLDHLPCQVGDGDGAAHLEDVGAVALGHRPGLQDQGDRLGDGHEVPDHVRVRDRYGAAGLYLLAEGRNDGAAATEHVPEADRGVDRLRVLQGEFSDDHLGQAFGRAHHVDGTYGLVGRDVDKLARPIGPRRTGDVEGAEDVVDDGLGCLLLHHGDVFVGGRMEDELWPEGLEGEADALRVRDVANEDLRVVEVLAPQLGIQIVQAALVPVGHNLHLCGGADGGAPDPIHLFPAGLGHGYDDLVYAVLGDEIFEVLYHPEDRRALYVPAYLDGRPADEADDLCLGRSRAPDVPGERHARLAGSDDNRPRPAPDLPQGHLVEDPRIETHGDELHIGEYGPHQRYRERDGVEVHEAKTPGTHTDYRQGEAAGRHRSRAQNPHPLVDAGVAQDALVDPVGVQEQHERERREHRERPEERPERGTPRRVSCDADDERNGERLDDYEGVDEHRRTAPERRRRAVEGPLQPVHAIQEPLPDPLQKPHRSVY